jgi:hypothetical protein
MGDSACQGLAELPDKQHNIYSCDSAAFILCLNALHPISSAQMYASVEQMLCEQHCINL